jgi:hypothetical protein
MDKDKHKTVNKGCAAIRRGKLMAKTYGIALVPVLAGRSLMVEGWQLGGDMPWTKILGKTNAYKRGEFHTQQSSNDE